MKNWHAALIMTCWWCFCIAELLVWDWSYDYPMGNTIIWAMMIMFAVQIGGSVGLEVWIIPGIAKWCTRRRIK